MKTQQMLEPALRGYFKGLISGGLSATQALSLYEESLLGDQLGKVALAREKARISFCSSGCAARSPIYHACFFSPFFFTEKKYGEHQCVIHQASHSS